MKSSAISEATLRPERHLRCLVSGSAWTFLVLGSVLIACLPLPAAVRLMLLVYWIADASRGIRAQRIGTRRVQLLRLETTGRISAQESGAEWQEMSLQDGSFVLRRIGWLRLKFADGCRYGELLQGDPELDEQWHSLQLIWRHAIPGSDVPGR